MSGATLFVFLALLLGALLAIIGIVVWQQAQRRPTYEPRVYVIEDAVRHVEGGLLSEGKTLSRADIRRILEWEVFYLQGLAQENRKNAIESVAGGHDRSIQFVIDGIAEKHDVNHSFSDVADVLRYEADYLVIIGAVGEPVESDGGA
ncbi:MAG: hypothetical protein OEM32_07700 [Acidimicrobiia bacterium]|nr:hypothetical protein [Acidimicrobiia bacterium]